LVAGRKEEKRMQTTCIHCKRRVPMSARTCPECGKPLGSAGDLMAMLILLGGFPAWLFLLYAGLIQVTEGNRKAGIVLLAVGLLLLGGAMTWLFTRRGVDTELRERDRQARGKDI